MAGLLVGKAALVTGSTSGLGRAMADALAAAGAHVVVTGRSQAAGERAVTAIRADGGQADYLPADLSGGAPVALWLAGQHHRAGTRADRGHLRSARAG